jgi:hypothetical protein
VTQSFARTALFGAITLLSLVGYAPSGAIAQGQDSTPGQRSVLIMAELLPGRYDNINQNYFDTRRNLPEADRHARMHTTITRIEVAGFGRFVFLWSDETERAAGAKQRNDMIVTLTAGPGADEVSMKRYLRVGGVIEKSEIAALTPAALRSTDGCEYLFKRRADHFSGVQKAKACRFDWEGQPVYTDNEIQLSRSSLWFHDHKFVVRSGKRITGVGSGEPFWMERARVFHCYVDVPGVGGGRDIPFNRYDDIELHDKGATTTFRTRDAQPKEIFLRLQSVTWQVLNEANDNFNRNSLVLYAFEKMPDGTMKNGSYVFTDPDATRVGNNLGWMLVNCALTKRNEARPEL